MYVCMVTDFSAGGFTDRREILHGVSATSLTGLLLFWGDIPGMAELRASTGAIWWDIPLTEALVYYEFRIFVMQCLLQ